MKGGGDLSGHFDAAYPGTLYWTISLYIPADSLSKTLGLPATGQGGARSIVTPEQWRKLAFSHRCSLILGSAMDPLFNDIADRDVQGAAQEFLLAASDDPVGKNLDERARKVVLDEIDVEFLPPGEIRWVTEGREFRATPPGMAEPRQMTLKRFWFAHYGGALSYHLSFCYRYKPLLSEADRLSGPLGNGYVPANYYFMSILQKLVAPKEMALPVKTLQSAAPVTGELKNYGLKKSIFEKEIGIDLLDHRIVRGLSPRTKKATPFWQGLGELFEADAQSLVRRLAQVNPDLVSSETLLRQDFLSALLDVQPVIEVPGLGMPRCRFMFFFHDDRFFNRLMPEGHDNTPVARKEMVQDGCYAPYLNEIKTRKRLAKVDPVELDTGYWNWVTGRQAEYAQWCADGTIRPAAPVDGEPPVPFETEAQQAAAIRSGHCVLTVDEDGLPLDQPIKLRVPSYETGRTDCLDYLFLSGFNQNIIDFMNQDTSEILDSTDPLYPESDDQAVERFFVRFANHRALITYVPSSRSLEIGNDYIGTCPYAFLIHVLVMHNEYLDRLHEAETVKRISVIENMLLRERGDHSSITDSLNFNDIQEVEKKINKAKLAYFNEYLRFRYINPFRYDTERDVYEKLELLRGTSRKQQSLKDALTNLEDHTYDLARQIRHIEDEREKKYEKKVAVGFSIVGLSSLIQMIYGLIVPRLADCNLKGKTCYDAFMDKQSAVFAEHVTAYIAIIFLFISLGYISQSFIKNNTLRFSLVFAISSMFIALNIIIFLR